MSPYTYIAEQFASALHTLAGTGALQDRLHQVALRNINFVRPENMPDRDLKRRVTDIMRRLSLVAAMGDEETIKATTSAMSDKEAQAVAEEIVHLALELDRKSLDPGSV